MLSHIKALKWGCNFIVWSPKQEEEEVLHWFLMNYKINCSLFALFSPSHNLKQFHSVCAFNWLTNYLHFQKARTTLGWFFLLKLTVSESILVHSKQIYLGLSTFSSSDNLTHYSGHFRAPMGSEHQASSPTLVSCWGGMLLTGIVQFQGNIYQNNLCCNSFIEL